MTGRLIYSASGLPLSMICDPETGEISGTTTELGKHSVTVTATSAYEPESWRERIALRRFLRHWQPKLRR